MKLFVQKALRKSKCIPGVRCLIIVKNTRYVLPALVMVFLVGCGGGSRSERTDSDNPVDQNDPVDPIDSDPQDDDQDDTGQGDDHPVDCAAEPYVLNECPIPPLADSIEDASTARPNRPFSKFQLDDSLYVSNVYDRNARAIVGVDEEGKPVLDPDQLYYSDGEPDTVQWSVPATDVIAGNLCDIPHGNDSIRLSYRLTYKNRTADRFDFVRAFPAMVVGTMGGRFDSWGVRCNDPVIIDTDYQRDGGSPVYDMNTVQEATGFPVFVRDLPNPIKVSVKANVNDGTATNGYANIFLDSYWHDVSTISKVPGGNRQWVNTINGINADYTEVWNLNIWFDWTETENRTTSQWTGGIPIGTAQITDNPQFDVYIKSEGPRSDYIPDCTLGNGSNCFLYIALVVRDRTLVRSGVTINYTEIAQWMQSEAFRNLFLDGIDLQGTGEKAGIAYEMWRTIDGPFNDTHPDPARRGPAFPNGDHLLGGVHLGSELWFNPQGQKAEIIFDTLGVAINGQGYFGKYDEYPNR